MGVDINIPFYVDTNSYKMQELKDVMKKHWMYVTLAIEIICMIVEALIFYGVVPAHYICSHIRSFTNLSLD